MINFLKTYLANLKHLPSTGAAILALIAYVLNKNTQVIPADIANHIMVLLGPLVLMIFVGNGDKNAK